MQKTITKLSKQAGRFAPEAFEFLRQGLDFTVHRTHGAKAESLQRIGEWLEEEGAEMGDLKQLVEENRVPPNILECIEELGGAESASGRVNLHVTGEDLCHGLRVLAQEQWGLLAPAVLHHWGIHSTSDFGRMVFALVESDLLQKQPQDRIEDFHDVYDFEAAFDRAYRIRLASPAKAGAEKESPEA